MLNPPLLRPGHCVFGTLFLPRRRVDGSGQWWSRSWRIRCREIRIVSRKPASRRLFSPNACGGGGRFSNRRNARPAKICESGQQEFEIVDTLDPVPRYEYAVHVTSLDNEILTIAQHYRDRGDAENPFDELKNQWGWSGYTTRGLKRCQLMARNTALIYNWWSLFARLSIPEKHAEAITSSHGKAGHIRKFLNYLTDFFRALRATAEQLDWPDRWRAILSRMFIQILQGRPLKTQKQLQLSP